MKKILILLAALVLLFASCAENRQNPQLDTSTCTENNTTVTSEKSEDLTTDKPDILYIPHRGLCLVHGDDYHAVPAVFINYLGAQDDMNVWFSAKDTPNEDGCV